MSASTFDVTPYSADRLCEILKQFSHGQQLNAVSKPHLTYLDGYLRDIKTESVVVEDRYTDRDYLEDYAAYYARCHESYGRRCARLHFFKEKLELAAIEAAMDGDSAAVTTLQTSYLGFIVVKPLPSTVIGRTCLVTYEGGRSYPTTRSYKVHLFGIELVVESLAFQEQDRDVAACATSALWSVFNKTGQLFQHTIPSPAEITSSASESPRVMNRALPAGAGLTAEQIADAIRSVGLEPGYVKAENIDLLLVSACAYLRAEIPVILLGALERKQGRTKTTLGLHAVALTGYGAFTGAPSLYGETLFTATASSKLYAHDDQLGPFAKLMIDRKKRPGVLTSSSEVQFRPQTMLVPLYHKIRVPIESVIAAIKVLDVWVEGTSKHFGRKDEPIVWDIRLTSNADFKRRVHEDKEISPTFRRENLLGDLPRYMWQVGATSKGKKLFDLLFDATDLLQGGHVTGGIPYSMEICLRIASLVRNTRSYDRLAASHTSSNRVLEMTLQWFKTYARAFESA